MHIMASVGSATVMLGRMPHSLRSGATTVSIGSAVLASAQTASNTGSSASGSSGANREEREVTSSIIEVTRADENSPMIAKVWVDIPGQEADPGDEMSSAFPPMLIYVKGSQSAAPSATARFGEFEMQMTYTLAEAFASPGGPSMPAGTGIGGAYLSASADSVVFKEHNSMTEVEGTWTVRIESVHLI